jgi:ribosomal protein S18 acetylase RimI-like enzyme
MIKIRMANRSDATCIIDFQLKMALETEDLELTKSVVENGVKAVFNEDSKGAYYVAEVDGKVVGSLLTTYEWSDWRNGQILWIQSVYVASEFRRKGIYKKMYEYIKNKVLDHKLDFMGIRLYVDKTNGNAQKVYKKLGMENNHYEMYEWMV